jgi:hypothetical protein
MASRSKDPEVNEEAFSEQNSQIVEPSVYDIKAQHAEVTLVEAFKQNVDGDQSPCMAYLSKHLQHKETNKKNIVPEVAACVPSIDDPDIACNSE